MIAINMQLTCGNQYIIKSFVFIILYIYIIFVKIIKQNLGIPDMYKEDNLYIYK